MHALVVYDWGATQVRAVFIWYFKYKCKIIACCIRVPVRMLLMDRRGMIQVVYYKLAWCVYVGSAKGWVLGKIAWIAIILCVVIIASRKHSFICILRLPILCQTRVIVATCTSPLCSSKIFRHKLSADEGSWLTTHARTRYFQVLLVPNIPASRMHWYQSRGGTAFEQGSDRSRAEWQWK